MPTLDRATLDAVKSTKREQHAQLSHKRQLARTASRKRATIAVGKEREASATRVLEARTQSAAGVIAARQQARSENIGAARSMERQDRAVGAVTSAATPSGDSNLIMTTIFLIFGLIIIYILVHNPGPTTGWLSGLGNSLHALSSNTPLFTTTAK